MRLSIFQTLFQLYIDEERYYHSIFIMIMYLTGISLQSEVSTSFGRADGVIEFNDKVYYIL
jgi:hypothetical protein